MRMMSRRRTGRRGSLLLAALLLAMPPALWPASGAARSEERVTLDFRNVEIGEFIRTVSKITGRNFLIDQNIRGTVTILGPTPVPVSEVWRIFHSVLEVKGLAVTEVGGMYKIIQRREARQANLPVFVGRSSPGTSDEPVIQIVPLNFSDADEVSNFLKNFSGKTGQIYSHKGTNSLVIVDEAVMIDKMLRMLKEVDSPRQEEQIEFVTLEHISAKEAIDILKAILEPSGGDAAQQRRVRRRGAAQSTGSSGGLRTVADERLNRVILIGSADDIVTARDLLAEVDREVPQGSDLIRVYSLQYGDAEQMAATLNTLLTGEAAARTAAGGKDAAAQQRGKVQVVADVPNNALIFVADQADYQRALSVLRKLDVPRPQVYVEAAIIEVFLNNSGDFSITGGIARPQQIMGEEGYVFGGEALGGMSPLGVNLESLAQLNGLFAGAIVTPASGVLPPLGAILRAIRTSDNVNVLSTPHLLTSDNEEAEIVVGDNVPFLTGQTATSGGNVISSIDRRDVGITLRVTPTINDSDYVRMQIYQEISSVSPQAPSGLDVNQQGLITRKRSAKTNVVVKHGQTVAVGGLISEEDSDSSSKVPILGDIPIIGWLFKSKTVSKRRTNLVIFLTPHILRSSDDMALRSREITERFEGRSDGYLSRGQETFLEGVYYRMTTDPAEAEERMLQELLVESEPADLSEVSAETESTPSGPDGVAEEPADDSPLAVDEPVATDPADTGAAAVVPREPAVFDGSDTDAEGDPMPDDEER